MKKKKQAHKVYLEGAKQGEKKRDLKSRSEEALCKGNSSRVW